MAVPDKHPRKKYRIVIFDYGGVISKPQNQVNIDRIIDKMGLSGETQFNQLYSIHRKDIDAGNLTLQEYWAKTLTGIRPGLSRADLEWLVREDIRSWADINKETVKLIMELKERGITLAILSNMVTETLDYLRENTSFIQLFDYPFFSCDFNLIKPDPRAYRYILNKMHVDPGICIFTDDLAENCEAAENEGIYAIRFRNVTQLRQELSRLI